MMYNALKRLYYKIPLKKELFRVVRKFYSPSTRISGYLKFRGVFQLEVEDKKLSLYNNDSTLASIIFWKGIAGYEKVSLTQWVHLSKQAHTIFDIGANFGLFGLLSKTINPLAKVYFFEPLKRNCDLVCCNIAINNFRETKVDGIALSDVSGMVDFYDMKAEENTIGSLDPDFIKSHSHAEELVRIQIPSLSLDTYIEKNQIEKIDLMKIDVEGAELLVMKGFIKYMRTFSPDILIEIGKAETAREIQELLESNSMSYNYYEIDEEIGLKRVKTLFSGKHKNFILTRKELI